MEQIEAFLILIMTEGSFFMDVLGHETYYFHVFLFSFPCIYGSAGECPAIYFSGT